MKLSLLPQGEIPDSILYALAQKDEETGIWIVYIADAYGIDTQYKHLLDQRPTLEEIKALIKLHQQYSASKRRVN